MSGHLFNKVAVATGLIIFLSGTGNYAEAMVGSSDTQPESSNIEHRRDTPIQKLDYIKGPNPVSFVRLYLDDIKNEIKRYEVNKYPLKIRMDEPYLQILGITKAEFEKVESDVLKWISFTLDLDTSQTLQKNCSDKSPPSPS